MSSKPKPPAALSESGAALWSDVVKTYDLRVDELSVLLGAAKTADRIAMLEKAHEELGYPFLTKGSMGQDVIHPLVAELRTQEAAKAALLGRLKLPEDGTAADTGDRSTQARAAANARWSRRGA